MKDEKLKFWPYCEKAAMLFSKIEAAPQSDIYEIP